jgi:hypothetical protein
MGYWNSTSSIPGRKESPAGVAQEFDSIKG